jgi:fatty-acyl-CoA synthase
MDSGLSWARGASEPPLLDSTIGEALGRAADLWGDCDALVSAAQDVRWTWRELADHADALAAGLLRLGLMPGDRLAIWAANCAEWALIQFATAKIGVILTTINPALREAEVEFVLNKVAAKAIVVTPTFKTSDYVAMIGRITVPHLRHLIAIGGAGPEGWLAFSQLSDNSPAAIANVREVGANLNPQDAINIQFTSGTTGLPKGATLSHRNILNNGYFVGLAQELTVADRICVPVPLYHCFGMVMANLAAVTCGAAVVYPCPAFDAEQTLRTVERERCTALYGVPTMFIAQLNHPALGQFDLSSLRTGIMAGSPCPMEVMRQLVDRMNLADITIAYGMTETSPVSFQSSVDDPLERRVATIGRVQPHLEVKIVDEQGNVTARGVPGEICTRGYSVMKGYWDESERTAEVLDADGWMHTGDLGTIDEAGYGNIVGRIKDMIIRGGENVYPREIEDFLIAHPKIADVQIVGVPSRQFGEELCVWVVPMPGQTCGEQEVLEFCRGRIAHFKIPRYVRIVDDFPLTASGKVQKYLIREHMIRELNISEDANNSSA